MCVQPVLAWQATPLLAGRAGAVGSDNGGTLPVHSRRLCYSVHPGIHSAKPLLRPLARTGTASRCEQHPGCILSCVLPWLDMQGWLTRACLLSPQTYLHDNYTFVSELLHHVQVTAVPYGVPIFYKCVGLLLWVLPPVSPASVLCPVRPLSIDAARSRHTSVLRPGQGGGPRQGAERGVQHHAADQHSPPDVHLPHAVRPCLRSPPPAQEPQGLPALASSERAACS